MPGATVLLLQQLSSKQKQLQPQSLALICTLRRCSKRLRTWPHLCWKAWPKVQNCRWAPVPRANQWLVAWPQRCFSGRSWWSNNQKKLWKNGCFFSKGNEIKWGCHWQNHVPSLLTFHNWKSGFRGHPANRRHRAWLGWAPLWIWTLPSAPTDRQSLVQHLDGWCEICSNNMELSENSGPLN